MRCLNRYTYLFPLCHLMTIARTRARFNLLVLAEIITSVAFEFCCTAGVILRWKFCSGIRGRRSSLRACAQYSLSEVRFVVAFAWFLLPVSKTREKRNLQADGPQENIKLKISRFRKQLISSLFSYENSDFS